MDKDNMQKIVYASENGAQTETKQIPLFAEDRAFRYNQGKLRYDLLEPHALKELVKVFTKGAEKYADRNWEKGMKWSKMLASLHRHLAAFEQGEDFDQETGLPHMAHASWNAMGLVSYMRMHPELDDRDHKYLNHKRIGLDIDNVICDWTKGWGEKYGCTPRPDAWSFSYGNKIRFEGTPKEELDELYRNLPRQIDPNELPFEPHCYITARSIDESLTKEWIERNGFPCAPVHTVPFGASKVEAAKAAGIEWMIDDSFHNFVELNNAGIVCFLYDAPHNRRYNVGYKRIMSFKDFQERFL
jgi:hypothetical protein